jgi:threonylcarbamoyladenosine tRNA methylthiotransferase MtaB
LVGDIFAHTELIAAPVFSGDDISGRTRPNLKVQDGCGNRCSFCIIPSVRGQSRSMKVDRVIAEANALVRAGYREIVLSGINLGRWGRDFEPQQRFEQLLRALLQHTGIEKIRISSVEPMDWSDELIALVATSSRIAKHAHLPLQSGSDHILRRMHRKYRPWHYAEKIRKIREAMPDAAIGADVMVGFPGETDELFEESRSFIEHLPFTYLHVFTYSSRPGTASAAMPDQVPVQVARERNRILRELAAEKNLAFRKIFIGRAVDVITLQTGGQGWTEALSDNYLRVQVAGTHAANQTFTVNVSGAGDEDVIAVIARDRRNRA